ncbi:MAG: GTP 3',8-cyclase MoaA [Dehalococcoidia bacterium]|nr:GTP 3',8-cyclase MoaA [Dehalococcoidia bacterium]
MAVLRPDAVRRVDDPLASSHRGVVDRRGRPVRDLRISVTDRCNFRCRYCMPREVFGPDFAFLPRAEILTFEEISRVARAFVAHGVRKLRLTGGEPTLRAGLPDLVRMLAAIPEVEIALTTNGSLLARQAAPLAEAGLSRLTVSLDSLDDAVFRRMNDADFAVADVLAGIDAAAAAGLPVKVNAVVRRGVNDQSVIDLAQHFRRSGHVVRFIEYMDVGTSNGWRLDDVVPGAEIIARINAEMPLEPVEARYSGEVARRWRYADGGGEVGVITSVSQPFCAACTRARIGADGMLYTCLFSTTGTDLRAVLRADDGDARLREVIAGVWAGRDDRYSELRARATDGLASGERRVEMSYIGG